MSIDIRFETLQDASPEASRHLPKAASHCARAQHESLAPCLTSEATTLSKVWMAFLNFFHPLISSVLQKARYCFMQCSLKLAVSLCNLSRLVGSNNLTNLAFSRSV